jgi:hypothetical protein
MRVWEYGNLLLKLLVVGYYNGISNLIVGKFQNCTPILPYSHTPTLSLH